jgi:hypothetical protein
MAERVAQHLLRLGVRFGEDHDLDELAVERLIRKCKLARVPFSIRRGVFFVGEEALVAPKPRKVKKVVEPVAEVSEEA